MTQKALVVGLDLLALILLLTMTIIAFFVPWPLGWFGTIPAIGIVVVGFILIDTIRR